MTKTASNTKSGKKKTAKKAGKTKSGKNQTANEIGSWTVKGVHKETITAAKMAAKRDGVFLGSWVDRTLREVANARLTDTPVPSVQEEDVMSAIAQLSAKVDAMSERRGFLSRIFSKAA